MLRAVSCVVCSVTCPLLCCVKLCFVSAVWYDHVCNGVAMFCVVLSCGALN